MSTDPTLLKALKTARSDVNTVIADIRARKDFSKTAGLKTSVTALSAYSQNLLNAETDIPLPDKSATALKAEASDVNTDVLANLINANIAMIGMGQLNMNRTIEPSVAKKDNVHMETSQASNSRLISLLQASSGQTPVVPVKDAVLKELKVTGAEKSETGLYYQFYSENQSVRVLAVTDPNTSGAWEEISWTGGREPSSQAANQRSVSLATLTTVGNPTKVTATVNGKSLSVEIAVVPDILGFDVSGAISDGDAQWTIEEDSTNGKSDPAVVRAVTEPATSAAYKFLKWTGGEVDPKYPDDRRLVDQNAVTDPNKPLPVKVEINLG